jgi:hypothetical protein
MIAMRLDRSILFLGQLKNKDKEVMMANARGWR